jgi:hypothetical protein
METPQTLGKIGAEPNESLAYHAELSCWRLKDLERSCGSEKRAIAPRSCSTIALSDVPSTLPPTLTLPSPDGTTSSHSITNENLYSLSDPSRH